VETIRLRAARCSARPASWPCSSRAESSWNGTKLTAPISGLDVIRVAGDDYILSASLQDDRGAAKTEGIASSPFSAEAGEQTRIEIHFDADAWIDVDTGTSPQPS
jgi:hypothetical protein